MATNETSPPELPTLPFPTPRAFADWLERNYPTSRGGWLKLAKKASGIASITYAQALEVALCWGWIDGQSRRVDETWYLQKFTPRSSRSIWSKINCAKATALIEAGRMTPAGLAEVERAKRDGRWARASAFFAGLDSRNRYAILHRIQTAKKSETRARRIAEFVRMMARREKLYP